jgi:RNA polymerase sigma factor (TIGR02999 family)
MKGDEEHSVTRLLRDWRGGDEAALDRLLPRVYGELRRLARRHLGTEKPGHTLGATGLVHEAFLRLVEADVPWQDRAHFLAVGARMMRRILVDHSRGRSRLKRGGASPRLSIEDVEPAAPEVSMELMELDRALEELADFDARRAQVVELVFFGGLSYEEVAEALGISRATAHRDLRLAKAWLHSRLAPESAAPPPRAPESS